MRLPLTRFFGPSITLIGLLALAYFGLSGGIDLAGLDVELTGVSTGDPAVAEAVTLAVEKPADVVRVVSFNIQKFGEKKSSTPEVMQQLARIVSQFDLVAVQEVLSPDSQPVQRLVDLLNGSGLKYDAVVSPPLGADISTQTEQYAFIWDTTRIQIISGSEYVVADPGRRMHREPMVATFEARSAANDGRRPFRFTLINVHTDPDEVISEGPENELNVLDDVYLSVREYESTARGEDDVILLGDLNVDVPGLRQLGAIVGITSVAGNVPTNTAGTEVYDHILINRHDTAEFTSRAGVIDYTRHFGLTAEQAADVSDHRPVWAEFSAYEIPALAPLAARPATTTR